MASITSVDPDEQITIKEACERHEELLECIVTTRAAFKTLLLAFANDDDEVVFADIAVLGGNEDDDVATDL